MVSVVGFVFLFVAVFFLASGINNKNDPYLISAAVVVAVVGGWLVSIST